MKTVDTKRVETLVHMLEEGMDDDSADTQSPSLVKVIAKEWDRELKRLKEKGLNGYKRRKEAKHESLV